MHRMFKIRHRTLIATLLGASAMLIATGLPLTSAPAAVQQTADEPADGIDRIILQNGRVIEGKILSETSTQIEILVIVKGIKAPTTYRKSEILSIERNVRPAEATPPKKAPTTGFAKEIPSTTTKTNADSSDGDRVYLITLNGDLGRDITKTPLEKVFDDAISYNPDVIVIKMNAGSRPRAFDGLWTAEALSPIIEKAIDDGRRIVFWIKRAEFGAAFLPFIGPEIYFMTDGTMGGIGDLSDFDMGDKTVNLKQISLRIGHAEGFAITGGYNPILIRAMSLKEAWLAVRWRGGKPQYITWEPRPEDGDGWVILTDDGVGDNKDEFSFEGDDVLTLDADLAQNLLLSKGTVDQMDDLAFELNLSRDYTVIDGRSKQILSDWRQRIDRTEDEIHRLQKRLKESGRNRGGRGSRSKASPEGKKINILKQIRSLLTAYEEVFDPTGQSRSNIDVQIEKLREAIRKSNQRR